ncbi:cysteine desulfurylase family member [Holotrichia oblita]|nr:cysteine desulfurylase family member [Holotrichia oblita]
MTNKIYADNAATTRLSNAAKQAMLPYLDEIYGNPSSLHSFGQDAAKTIHESRETIAKLLNANTNEIYFTSGGSESDNQAIISAAGAGAMKGKKHIISSKFEHHAVLHTLKRLKKEGFEITLLDVCHDGIVRVEDVKNSIREDTALVTIMYANNEIGTIQPVGEIGAVCRERGVFFHTDAVQAAGQLPIDVKAQNIDMLSISAHKFHSPKGVGALYCKKGIPLSIMIEGGAQERGKRAGTENIPAIVGMAAAFDETCRKMGINKLYISALRDKLIDGLINIPHTILNGDKFERLPGNVNLCFEGIEGESLLLLLNAQELRYYPVPPAHPARLIQAMFYWR